MMVKNTEKGNCPFRNLEPCSETCSFYRKGLRYKETNAEPVPFEECAINIIADNLESMHNRTYMMQREVGEAKNIIALKTMVDLEMADIHQNQDLKNHIRKVVNNSQQPKKALDR